MENVLAAGGCWKHDASQLSTSSLQMYAESFKIWDLFRIANDTESQSRWRFESTKVEKTEIMWKVITSTTNILTQKLKILTS